MKIISILFLLGGVGLIIYSFTLKISNISTTYFPYDKSEVVNFSLMQLQQNLLILGVGAFISGVFFLGIDQIIDRMEEPESESEEDDETQDSL